MADTLLRELLETPGTSGAEQRVQEVVRRFVTPFADTVTTDVHGNVLATINPQGTRTILLDAHCDQIGLIVRHIDGSGFLRVNAIGGWDTQILLGQRMLVHTATGAVPGVIARKPIHLLDPDERKSAPKLKELWIDIGSASEAESRALVRIGDWVTPEPCLRELLNGRISSPALDDRAGLWVVLNAFRRAAEAGPAVRVCVLSSVQEEIGLRGATTGAFTAAPDVAIAVDVTHATDCPGIDQNEFGRIELGRGPVVVRGPNANPRVVELLLEQATALGIPVQINALGAPASNDAATLQLTRGGVATGLVTIPNRYMHSPVELIARSDLEQAASLLAAFCLAVRPETSFIP
ncbi:MAG: putative aminopeptidase YsdC [Planctomycetota bacterium]|jgi:endoglucanase